MIIRNIPALVKIISGMRAVATMSGGLLAACFLCAQTAALRPEVQPPDNAVRKMFSVSKDELAKREAKWKRNQARKKRTTKRS